MCDQKIKEKYYKVYTSKEHEMPDVKQGVGTLKKENQRFSKLSAAEQVSVEALCRE